jgi:hypothetical protein
LDIILEVGNLVVYKDKVYQIKSPVNMESVLLEDVEFKREQLAKLSELVPFFHEDIKRVNQLSEVSEISKASWDEAKRRKEIIHPLTALPSCSRSLVKEAGLKLNISIRYVYKLIVRYRNSNSKLFSLLPYKPTGGVGKRRISQHLEDIIQQAIEKLYLSKQKLKLSVIYEEIKRCCSRAKIKPPGINTVRSHIPLPCSKKI